MYIIPVHFCHCGRSESEDMEPYIISQSVGETEIAALGTGVRLSVLRHGDWSSCTGIAGTDDNVNRVAFHCHFILEYNDVKSMFPSGYSVAEPSGSAADGNIQRHNLTDGLPEKSSMTPVDNINTGGSVVSPFCLLLWPFVLIVISLRYNVDFTWWGCYPQERTGTRTVRHFVLFSVTQAAVTMCLSGIARFSVLFR